MTRIKHAYRTAYAIIFALMVLGIIATIFPYQANAKTHDQIGKLILEAGFKQIPLNPTLNGLFKPFPALAPTIAAVKNTAVKAKTKVEQPRKNTPIASKTVGQQSGRDYGAGEIQSLIISYSKQYGIDSQTPLCIAQKESGFNANARNPHSTAKGVFQYLDNTWRATDEGKVGLSVFSAEANIKAAVKYMGVHKSTKPWVAAKLCPPLKFL